MKKIKATCQSVLLMIITSLFYLPLHAQINPPSAIYYQNQYQANPAMAGVEKGLRLNFGLLQQWSSIQGAPKTQTFTLDYGTTKKAGLGLSLYNDKAGLMSRTRLMTTYAYHLPLGSADQKLSFGLSLGFMNERLDHDNMDGDQGDLNVIRFNQRKTFIDGDFGMAYTGSRLTIQGSMPNLKVLLKKDENFNAVDRATFYSAISYKFFIPQVFDLNLEPKFAYRGIKNYDNIADFGLKAGFADSGFNLLAVYHTTQSTTLGMGFDYKKLFSFMGMYTTETAALRGSVSGGFEVALKVNVL